MLGVKLAEFGVPLVSDGRACDALAKLDAVSDAQMMCMLFASVLINGDFGQTAVVGRGRNLFKTTRPQSSGSNATMGSCRGNDGTR